MSSGQWSTSPDSALPLEIRDGPVYYNDGINLIDSTMMAFWFFGYYNQEREYTQKLTTDGLRIFGPEGQRVCPNVESVQGKGRCTLDTSGGCFLTWRDYRSGNYDIYGQHFNAAGEFLWDSAGVALVVMPGHQTQSICPDGAGGFYLGWVNDYGATSTISVCRYNSEGNRYWDYLLVSNLNGGHIPGIAPDDDGGAIIIWYNDNTNALYGQRITASGEILWTPNGHYLANNISNPANSNYSFPFVISDGEGGALYRGDASMLRVSPSGDVLWTQTYAVSWPGSAYSQQIELTPSGKIYAVVLTSGTGFNDVFLSCLNLNGGFVWENVNFTNPSIEKEWPSFTLTSNGVICHVPYMVGTTDAMYAQAVDSLGNILWRPGGVEVYDTEEHCFHQHVYSDLSDGAIGIFPARIVWLASSDDSLYASRILPDGTLGFLPVIDDLTVEMRESGAELRWGALSGALMYNIFTSLEAGSFPVEPDTSVADTVYIDVGAMGEMKKFYRVTYVK